MFYCMGTCTLSCCALYNFLCCFRCYTNILLFRVIVSNAFRHINYYIVLALLCFYHYVSFVWYNVCLILEIFCVSLRGKHHDMQYVPSVAAGFLEILDSVLLNSPIIVRYKGVYFAVLFEWWNVILCVGLNCLMLE